MSRLTEIEESLDTVEPGTRADIEYLLGEVRRLAHEAHECGLDCRYCATTAKAVLAHPDPEEEARGDWRNLIDTHG